MMKMGVVLCGICAVLAGGCTRQDGKTKIGIVQLVEHEALDAAYRGFVDALSENGYVDGENVTIDYQNAQGEQANCVTIAQKFVNDRSDLILAIATPAAQAAANYTTQIPILVTAVTDPESAHLVNSNAHPGTNVSGTSDLTPCAAQIELLVRILPAVRTVGMLYCSSEQNSIFQINLAKAACDQLGLTYIDATVSNSNEIQQVVQSLVGRVDALYLPTDNMIAAGMATVAQVANANRIPTVCGEANMVRNGGMITYGIDYYELGRQTGMMAVAVLRDGASVADMPIQYVSDDALSLAYNEDTLTAVGVTLPADLR